MKLKHRWCSTHNSLQGEWSDPDKEVCQVRELSLVTDECVMETVLIAPIDRAKSMQLLLDAYIEPVVREPL